MRLDFFFLRPYIPFNFFFLVALMDFGFVTHAVHANSRLVYLKVTSRNGLLTVHGPPNGNIYPPGPGWLHVVVDGIPSEGMKVMVGSGKGPTVDETALRKFVSRKVR
jgi:hypothetical protein